MLRSRRELRHSDGITEQHSLQPTSATKSAQHNTPHYDVVSCLPCRRGSPCNGASSSPFSAAGRVGGARRAGATAAGTDGRVPDPGRFSLECRDCRFCRATTCARLDRGSHHHDRVSLVGGTARARRRDRGRVCASEGRRHCHERRRRRNSKAGDSGHPDRLCIGGRSGRQRLGRKSGATGRQRHRTVAPTDRYCRQATRTLA